MPAGLDLSGLDKVEVEAALLYKHACKCEAEGDLTAALNFYQKAFRLVPDINEKQVHNIAQRLDGHQPASAPAQHQHQQQAPLAPRPRRIQHLGDVPAVSRQQIPALRRSRHAIDDHPNGFIGIFAPEIVHHIFSFLNPESLDLCGQVCVQWHVLSRDGELWKRHCLQVWDNETSNIEAELQNYNDSWRQLYISKPHIHFDGVYVSKTSYIRSGEARFGEGSSPILVCQYFRYLRFLPNNGVLVLLSNKKPKELLWRLRNAPETLKDVVHGRALVVDTGVLVEVPQDKYVFEYALRITPGNSKTRQILRWESMTMCVEATGSRSLVNQAQGPFVFVTKC